MIVSRSAYLDGLKGRVSKEEREALENGGPLLISRYNRETLLRMLRDDGGAGTVDTLQADALERRWRHTWPSTWPSSPRGTNGSF